MKAGASLWIGLNLSVAIGPFSSIGSPMTFMILPRVSWPTGTLIGFSVSTTGCPLTNPSVESRAMVRTLLPPKCWATSRTRRWSVPSTSRALRIGGSSPSNWTSTTAPMTWEILPFATLVENASKWRKNDQTVFWPSYTKGQSCGTYFMKRALKASVTRSYEIIIINVR